MKDIKRVKYFEYEFLDAEDFEVEQEYHRSMRYRHNRDFHTWGIGYGLEVSLSEDQQSGKETKVTVNPGTAVDGEGREIVLASSKNVDFNQPGYEKGKSYYITIKWDEQPGLPSQQNELKRWEEIPGIDTSEEFPEDPNMNLVLAKVTLRDDENNTIQSIDDSDRRYAAIELGDDTVTSATIVKADGTSDQDIDSGDGIKTGHIQDGAVTNAKLGDGSVNEDKLSTATKGKLVTNGNDHKHSGGDGAQIKHSSLNKDDGTNPHGTTAANVRALPDTGGTVNGNVSVNGNVGIGTTNPQKNIHIQGTYSAPLTNDWLHRPGLAITGTYPELTLFSGTNNLEHGAVILMGGYNDDSQTTFKHWSIGTSGRNSRFLDFGFGSINHPNNHNPHTGIRNMNGKTVMTLLENGNVGIGTLEPQKNIHIQGINSAPLCNDGQDRPGLAITGYYPQLDLFSSIDNTNTYHGPTIRMGGYTDNEGKSSKHWSIGTAGRNSRFLDIGVGTNSNPNPHVGIRNWNGKTVMTLLENGHVGIGTLEPTRRFHVVTFDAVGLFESTGPQAYLTLSTNEGFDRRVDFCNRPGGRASIWNSASGDVLNVLRNGNVGIGTVDPGGDRLDVRGRCYSSGGWHGTNSDYAEYFEAESGSEIPAGTSVTITKNGKIKVSKEGEIPIGIISVNPAIVGNSYKEWPKKYLRDEFGNKIMEEYKEEILVPKKEKVKKERQKVEKKKVKEKVKRTEIVKKKGKYYQVEVEETEEREIEEPVFKEVDLYDEKSNKKIGKHKLPVMETYEEEIDVLDDKGKPVMVGSGKFETRTRPKINPGYDEKQTYITRDQRPEWNCVGLLGQLPLRKGQPVAPSWIKLKDISKDVELWLVK